MCGRYSSKDPAIRRLEAEFVFHHIRLVPRFNIAPTQKAPIIRLNDNGQAVIEEYRWGLVPSWSKTDKEGARMINARSETVAQLPAYRSAFKSRRCLVIADGFYEWIQTTKPKQPLRFVMRDPEMPMLFAGIWETWRSAADPEQPLHTYSILTTTPNDLVAQVHDRMPVILPAESWHAWLDGKTPAEKLEAMLKPYPDEEMDGYRVTPEMNNARFEDPRAVEKYQPEAQLPLF